MIITPAIVQNASASRKNCKSVIQTLIKCVGTDDVRTNDSRNPIKAFLKYRCWNPRCLNSIVRFQEKTGYSNPCRHLMSGYARNQPFLEQEKVISQLLCEARQKHEREGNSVAGYFKIHCLSVYNRAVHAYLRLITSKHLPLSIITSRDFRFVSRFNQPKVEKLSSVIYKLQERAERKYLPS